MCVAVTAKRRRRQIRQDKRYRRKSPEAGDIRPTAITKAKAPSGPAAKTAQKKK